MNVGRTNRMAQFTVATGITSVIAIYNKFVPNENVHDNDATPTATKYFAPLHHSPKQALQTLYSRGPRTRLAAIRIKMIVNHPAHPTQQGGTQKQCQTP